MSKREQTSIDLQLSQRSALKAQHMLSTPTQVFTLIWPNETFSEDCVGMYTLGLTGMLTWLHLCGLRYYPFIIIYSGSTTTWADVKLP